MSAASESGSEFDEELAQVEAEMEEENNMDESQFKQFETGELDLPSDDEDEEMSEASEAEDLDDYYREIGVDPAEMKTKPAKATSKDTAVYQTKEKKNKRSEVID